MLENAQEIERLVQAAIDEGEFAHAQLLIARDGEIISRLTTGKAREDGSPLREDSLFRIASMTKPVTSTGFMMLVDEGRAALEQPVADVIPEFASFNMRMIDLLRHTSGLTYGLQNRTEIDAAYRREGLDEFHRAMDADAFIARLAALPLEFAPGTAWNYSVSTDVLGIVIERLSGRRLEDFLTERVFAPLGMNDSAFTVPADRIGRLTDVWMRSADGRMALFDRGARSRWRFTPKFVSGGSGLVTSIDDYHRFCRMMLNGGALDGIRILKPETVGMMTVNQLPGGKALDALSQSNFSEAEGPGLGFGLGIALTLATGSYFWGGIFSTFFQVDPGERSIVILMTQMMSSQALPLHRQLSAMLGAPTGEAA